MKTKYLLLFRHGEGDVSLSKDGKKMIASYEYILQQIFASLTIGIYYSPHCLAKETAEMLSKFLSPNECIVQEKLLVDKDHYTDFGWLSNFVQEKKDPREEKQETGFFAKLFKKQSLQKNVQVPIDVLVLVTHMDYVEFFPSIYAKKMGVDKKFSFMTSLGKSVLLDLNSWEAILLPCKDPELQKFLGK